MHILVLQHAKVEHPGSFRKCYKMMDIPGIRLNLMKVNNCLVWMVMMLFGSLVDHGCLGRGYSPLA